MPDATEPVILNTDLQVDCADYQLYLPPELIYFRGHFPGHPVLPGVVQLRWAVSLAEPLGVATQFNSLERLKYTRLMVPGLTLQLTITRAADSGFDFRYHDPQGDFSSGRLRYN